MFWGFLLFLVGHFGAALALYFNHRYVFHGKLSRYPFFKQLAKLHALHHAHSYSEKENDFIFAPWWVRIVLFTFVTLVGLTLSWWIALGLASFWATYAYYHWDNHHGDGTSYLSKHHNIHHKGKIHKNLSGVYPVIDYIFGTNA